MKRLSKRGAALEKLAIAAVSREESIIRIPGGCVVISSSPCLESFGCGIAKFSSALSFWVSSGDERALERAVTSFCISLATQH